MTKAKNKPKRPECPDEFTTRFARELVKYLGGNPTPIKDDWCWKEFAEAYPELRQKAERYFESAKTGGPGYAAYRMVHDCGSSREWAERIIEHAQTGNPSWAAFCMVHDCDSSRKWAERVIERAETGNPAWAASKMVHFCGSSPEWAESIKRKWKKEKENND